MSQGPKSKTKTTSHVNFRKKNLDPISPTFCAAKWLNLTLWLNSGKTASCHHPLAHQIEAKNLKIGPDQLHNTPQKILARKEMLSGKRPAECNYCWRIEDLGNQFVSDRVFKSEIYSPHEIQELKSKKNIANVVPKTLEIAFDSNCNFACSYCNQHFSSKWASDIEINGPFRLLLSGWNYNSNHNAPRSPNPTFVDSFWKWWPTLRTHLQELRITGGEPLLSKHTWSLLESLADTSDHKMKVSVNSNLGCSPEALQRLIRLASSIPSFDLYTSNETTGALAEYVRDGLNWKTWTKNVLATIKSQKLNTIHFMMTISALSLEGTPKFLNYFLKLRTKFPDQKIALSVNILRFPHFQAVLVLPFDIRINIQKKLVRILKRNHEIFLDFEIEYLERLIEFLGQDFKSQKPSLDLKDHQNDLRLFIKQYDLRRSKDFQKVFSTQFCKFVQT